MNIRLEELHQTEDQSGCATTRKGKRVVSKTTRGNIWRLGDVSSAISMFV